ncbi:hypothetical protein [Flagellimonas iocasae]|uniref:Lipoprotein n=1 Tax=Flagellimonas iocasae TaxID=2055905 RepID=A0ABW4XZZ6_9FLAO
MKLFLGYSLVVLYLLCGSFCCRYEDDYDFVTVEAEITNLATIEGNKAVFVQNEILYLTVNIPRKIVTTKGKSIDLAEDLGAQSCSFRLKLRKKGIFETPSLLVLSENEIFLEEGDVSLDDYEESVLNCSAVLQENSYVLHLGIQLKEKGDFILSQDMQTKSEWKFYFSDSELEDNTFEDVTIISPLDQENSTVLGFEFLVE